MREIDRSVPRPTRSVVGLGPALPRLRAGRGARGGAVWYTRREDRRGARPVLRVTLDAEAGRVSEELARRGIAAGTRVRVLAEVVEGGGSEERLPMAALAQAGGAFAFLADEPDLYTDADVVGRDG